MLQYSLLLLEIVLLGATAYIYWTTRRLVDENETLPSAPPLEPGRMQSQISVSEMMQDISDLMNELQSVAGTTRDDLIKRRDDLAAMLQHAENVTGELRNLVSQAETVSIAEESDSSGRDNTGEIKIEGAFLRPPGAPRSEALFPREISLPPEDAAPVPDAEPAQTPLIPLELIYSPAYFGEYLRISGCGHEVVTLATQHAQEFVLWFNSQFDEDEAAPSQIPSHYLEKYLEYLEARRYDLEIIKRKFIALKAYINWANSPPQVKRESSATPKPAAPNPAPSPRQDQDILLGREAPPQSAPPPAESSIEDGALPSRGELADNQKPLSAKERHRTVFAMADEGFDQLAIAARTGLEQEVVRMLLVMGQSAYASA